MKRTAIAVSGFLAGCAALGSYAPPGGGPQADLRVFGNALGGTILAVARDEPGCGDGGGRLVARLAQSQPPDLRPVYLPDGAPAPAPAVDAKLPTGRPFTLLVQAQGLLDGWYGYGCARAVTFTPQARARYEAVFVSEDPYRCRIDVWRVEPGYRETPQDLDRQAPQCALRAYRS